MSKSKMSRSEKYAETPKENWLIAILVVITIVILFWIEPGMREFWGASFQNKLLVLGLIILMFFGSLWNYSKPYWRLRDKMVDSVSGRDAGTDKRAWLPMSILVLVGLVIGLIISLISI